MNDEIREIQALTMTREFIKRADAVTLGAPPSSSKYLENRLLLTLNEGIEIGRRLQAREDIERLKRIAGME